MGFLIAVGGRKSNGKSSVADYIINKYGYTRYAFADPMKEAVKVIFDFSDEQLNGDLKELIDTRWGISPRQAMQTFATELCQFDLIKYLPALEPIGRKIWVHRFKMWYEKNKEKNIIISDLRFEHEAEVIKELGGCIWSVERPQLFNVIDNHSSENSLPESYFDERIINDLSLADLNVKVDLLIKNKLRV